MRPPCPLRTPWTAERPAAHQALYGVSITLASRDLVESAIEPILERARTAHASLSAKRAQLEAVDKLCANWTHALLDVTFPLESALDPVTTYAPGTT